MAILGSGGVPGLWKPLPENSALCKPACGPDWQSGNPDSGNAWPVPVSSDSTLAEPAPPDHLILR